MLIWHVSLPEDMARAIEAPASEVGLSRDDFVSQVLRVGLDHRSREAGQRSAFATPCSSSTRSTASTTTTPACGRPSSRPSPARPARRSATTISISRSTLSDAVFVATANSLGAVPRMWRERMSVLDLPGYTEREKRVIATRHLLPWQLAPHGLTAAAWRPRRSTVVLPPPARPTAIARSPSRYLVCSRSRPMWSSPSLWPLPRLPTPRSGPLRRVRSLWLRTRSTGRPSLSPGFRLPPPVLLPSLPCLSPRRVGSPLQVPNAAGVLPAVIAAARHLPSPHFRRVR